MARRLPNFLMDSEPERLLRAATTNRDRVMLLMLLYCGLRVSEVTKLKCGDLDMANRRLFVREGKGKKDRVVPIPKKIVGQVRAWLHGRDEGNPTAPVFPSPRGGHLTTRAVQLMFKRLAQSAGLPNATAARRVNPHKFRHAYATRLLRSGASVYEVKELLGHSSIAVTETYLHATADELERAADRL